MKLYQRVLATGAAIATIGLSGCKIHPRQTLEGTVINEFGIAQRIIESDEAILGNESVKFNNPIYGLVIGTDTVTYVITVNNHPLKPVTALARAIESGDKVRITYDLYTYIGNDGIGKTNSDTIELIEKAERKERTNSDTTQLIEKV